MPGSPPARRRRAPRSKPSSPTRRSRSRSWCRLPSKAASAARAKGRRSPALFCAERSSIVCRCDRRPARETAMPVPVRHRRTTVGGVETFYRQAGPADAPVVLLPHGYPASSYVYRNLMAALGDTYRLIAPDLPGFGYSATPSADDFGYTFAAYGQFLERFVETLRLDRYVIWLHDYGSQFGFQL